MAQEAQKTPLKAATVPKPGPSPKGIPQPSVLGKEPPKPKEDSDENPAEATIQDFSAPPEEELKKREAPKTSTSKPEARPNTPLATTAAPVTDETDPDIRFNKDLEARLSREIEARLRKELEPRLAKEIELKLLRQFDSQLQKVVNDSVERAIKRHSQPNLPTISREEIAAVKAGQAALTAKSPTPMMFKALGATEPAKPGHLLTPGHMPVARHPSQPAMPKAATPAALAVTKPSSGTMPKATSPAASAAAFPAVNLPIASPAQETSKPEPQSLAASQGLQLTASSTTPITSPAEPVPAGATQGAWVQDPAQQKAFQTQQIRVSKVRVSLDDVSPERLIGPSSEDLGKDFLKDAGVSRGGKIAVMVMLLLALTGGSAFGVYYVYGRQVPNPPRVGAVHAAVAGLERGTIRFPEGNPDIAVVFQPPTMLLAQGKGKRPAAVAPKIAPKATPTPTPPPKVEPPKTTPPKVEPPKLKVVPRDGP